MHWLLQKNISTDEQLIPFVDALDYLKTLGATWSYIKLIPFVGDVEPDDDYTGKKVFALGSTSMILAAQKRNWNPGVIYNKSFRFEEWRKHWSAYDLINGNAKVSKFKDVKATSDNFFIRPCEDLKTFSGQVMSKEELINWQKRVNEGEVSSQALELTNNTMVMVSREKIILREWRFFVVAGKVITGSQYRTIRGLDISADVDQDVYDFAQRMENRWSPAICYCLDIAETSRGLGIMEINCFNGSGAYACDLRKAFSAVEQFYNS